MSVRVCIEPATKQRIAEWDMGKDPDDVSEGEWIAWFTQGFVVDPRALDTLKMRIKSAVVFDMSVPDADSRIGRMLDGLAAAIRRDRQEWVIREESQAIVKIITDAIKTASLRRSVTEQMALMRNKPLKKDVYRFVGWLREYAIGHERFVGYEEELKPPTRIDLPKPPGSKVLGGPRDPRGDTKPLTPIPNAPAIGAPNNGCLKCKSTSHRVRECPGITPEEVKQLLRAHGSTFGRGRGEKGAPGVPGGRVATVKTNVPDAKRPELPAIVDGVLPVQASLLDSGADLSVASGGLVSALLAAGASPEITVMGPMELRPYGADSQVITVTKQVRLGSLEFKTTCGPLMLRGLRHLLSLALGLPVMQKLGYNEQTLLENARRQQAVWDFGDQPITTPGVAMHRTLRMGELSEGIDDDEGMAYSTPELGDAPDDDGLVRTVLNAKVAEAATAGMPAEAVEQLRDLLMEFRDVFRLKFGRNPPVKVEPLKVRLKEGSVPVKSGLRRYPPTHMAFLEKHVRELEEAGLVYRSTRSCWASAPRIVPKKDPGDLSMTINSRPINACTEPMPWPMPNLEVAMGYWQLSLHPDSQEYYSFMTPVGVVTPTRVLMGQTDAVVYCQGVVDESFGDLLMHGLLGWLDDLLGYAPTTDELLHLLRKVLEICHAYGLKLHPGKCVFYTTRTVPVEDLALPASDQRHEPLAFLSGSFRGASGRWPIVEKEAFAVVESCKRLEYLLIRPGGFRLFTDHRNLAHKLQRWALTMTAFPYVVECVAGEENLWADLLSRWGSPPGPDRSFPVESRTRPHPTCEKYAPWSAEKKSFLTAAGKIWIPGDALDMQVRICVVAHAGVAGHRRVEATTASVAEMFDWPTLKTDVKNFVNACLHCMVVDGESAPGSLKYVLVIKDDISGFVRLHASTTASAAETAAALMEWFGLFGVVRTWVSDSGSHFKNELVSTLGRMFGVHHHFVTPHCPWANRTVEVVNRIVIRTLKTLCSEMRLQPGDWPGVLPLVQSALNQQPVDRLDGVEPTTAFTGLPATPPLTGLVHPDEPREVTIDWIKSRAIRHVTELADALGIMHKHVAETVAAKRAIRPAGEIYAGRFCFGGPGPPASGKDIVALEGTLSGREGGLRLPDGSPAAGASGSDVPAPCVPAPPVLRGWLKTQIAFGDEGFYVEDLRDLRLRDEVWEVLIKWLGLDDLESSWEPALSIYEDVPVLFRRWAKARSNEDGVYEMIDDLTSACGHPMYGGKCYRPSLCSTPRA
ncbi:hypothetical protein H257_07762 [Aphanomyces astaci]|uniref:Reverse transcriptase n=1 Tax=Aphanomyces astaci TaxID=112090 RepID=W4GJ73_APHAT|nr:hypothetical protein H257_07762 [Aphanomyces astaci]ETV78978.1 hypothetical protein H257_07762 [Aphanomyces astaci]|eukprot:XP_009831697.1 hypothetical protein H257_07762 [Aphanomyces astaci]